MLNACMHGKRETAHLEQENIAMNLTKSENSVAARFTLRAFVALLGVMSDVVNCYASYISFCAHIEQSPDLDS